MATDACKNPIVIGKEYGYSSNSNGHIHVVIGTATAINGNRVTISSPKESSGVYGELGQFKPVTRARNVYGASLFLIND